MRKETYEINLSYTFDANRRGSKYTLDGERWMNHGDFCECLAKSVLGFEPKKDANTRNDKGHDIEELNASVKSWNCGLSDRKDLGKDRETYVKTFFSTELPNTTYIWVFESGEYVDLWYLNEEEFRLFVDECAMWDNHCEKIRFKLCNNKINVWLESKLVA